MTSERTLAEVQRELRRAGSVSVRIAELNPERDFLEIYRLHALGDFPWDTTRALELALFRTYCVPSIGGLLDQTGEFSRRGQLRYEDTSLLLAHVLEHGFQADGLRSLRRINQLHGRFAISNEDMLYVLSTFVSVPMRWLERFGWRPLLEAERIGAHNYYRALGTHMGIRDIPDSWQRMLAFGDAYERAHFAFNEASARVGEATREILVRWFPRPLAPLVRNAVYALLDPPVRTSFGFPAAPAPFQRAIERTLRARARVLAHLPARTSLGTPTGEIMLRVRKPDHAIDALGPP
ncbi:MAG TPA: oxygenase MpaB family protein [Polyangiales bacterium]|nr:oxygenase MpaB family protein [Polyangiales bacterium]